MEERFMFYDFGYCFGIGLKYMGRRVASHGYLKQCEHVPIRLLIKCRIANKAQMKRALKIKRTKS